MTRGYKIRIYPTRTQEKEIWKHIGSCRWVWNYMLNTQDTRYENGEKCLTNFDMMNLISKIKKQDEYKWLNEISNISIQRTCSDLWMVYKLFFKKSGEHPRYKSKKRQRQKYPVRSDRFYFNNDFVHVEKIGNIKFKSDYTFPNGRQFKYQNVRIEYLDGKYMLSFSVECENQARNLNEFCMGIDLGVKELAVVAYGNEQLVFHNINKIRKIKHLQKRKTRINRKITRKAKASMIVNGKYIESHNMAKEIAKLRKTYRKISNINDNHIHQVTAKLIALKPSCVVMESLNVEAMLKNRWLRKQVKEERFTKFINTMKYKCENNKINFIQVDRYYPSSKICSCCGHTKEDLNLSDRIFKCAICGNILDRDYNAALNLMKYALHNQEV